MFVYRKSSYFEKNSCFFVCLDDACDLHSVGIESTPIHYKYYSAVDSPSENPKVAIENNPLLYIRFSYLISFPFSNLHSDFSPFSFIDITVPFFLFLKYGQL